MTEHPPDDERSRVQIWMESLTPDQRASASLQTPYHYARDHDGPSVWCVRGPHGFYVSIPEKNLAWAFAAMLNGHGTEASKMATGLLTMLKDRLPPYLKGPERS